MILLIYIVLGVENIMATVVVKAGEPLDKALKRFNKVSSVKRKEARKREHWMSKKEKRRYKQEQSRSFR